MLKGVGFATRRLIQKIIEKNWGEKKQFTVNELLFILQEINSEEGKQYLEHQSVNRGFHVFREFVKYLLYRNMANYDSMILITALKGTGKSSAAIMIAREWCKLLGIQFNPKRHIAYNNADVMSKIDNLKPFEPIICDEAVRFATSADWNKKENKELKKKLAQVRTKHLLYILCFPLKVDKLEKTYLESFVNHWIDLFDRGIGAVYVRNSNPQQSAWGLEHFKKMSSYNEFTAVSTIEKRLKTHPNFWRTIKFPKPPKWLYEKYMKVRETNIYDDANVMRSVTKEDIYRALLILSLRDMMMHDTAYTMNRIILHIKNEYDITIPKPMLNSCITDAKQLVLKVREQALIDK